MGGVGVDVGITVSVAVMVAVGVLMTHIEAFVMIGLTYE
jgi:hypothetical protein